MSIRALLVTVGCEKLIYLGTGIVVARPRPPVEVLGHAYATKSFVAFSRMYRGFHYPTDVLAGAVLGGVWLLVTTWVLLLPLASHERSSPR